MRSHATDNRAIVLTPPGVAAIAVIRITGPGVAAFLEKHFSRPVRPLRVTHGQLRDGENVIDDPVVVLSADGNSADINLHGGAWVVESSFQLLARNGFERAATTEMPDSIESEMLASLPLAKTEAALRMLLAQPEAWRDFIAANPSPAAIDDVLHDVCLHRLLNPPRVAIIGAPNVGKSTLANQLFARERSVTADMPGTTRDWVGEIANIDGLAVMLVDTPGQRETTDAIERQAIHRSRGEIAKADLVIHVIAPSPNGGLEMLDEHDDEDAITVLNKFDILKQRGFDSGGDVLKTVATTGEGIDWLRAAIRTRLGCRDLTPDRPRWWTNRQRDILRRAIDDPKVLAEI